MILGTKDYPDRYSVWGKIDSNTKKASYHDRFLLREVSRQKSSKRSSQYAFDAGDDDEFIPEVVSSKRRRTSTGTTGSKDPASKSAAKIVKRSTYTPVSDDEEDLTLRQLSDSRRKAAAGTIDGNRSTAT